MTEGRYYGKVLGALAGWLLLKHPIGLLLGAVLGHVLDAGWLRRQRRHRRSALEQAYAVLGVAPEASDEAIEQAYRRLIREYHPDRLVDAADEIRDLAEERSRAINAAHDLILKARHGTD